jgi:hypothetical protein
MDDSNICEWSDLPKPWCAHCNRVEGWDKAGIE